MYAVMPLGEDRFIPHTLDFGNVREYCALALGQAGEKLFDARLIIGDILPAQVHLVAGAAVAVAENGIVRRADALHLTGGQDLAGRHLIQLEFQ